MDKIGTILGVDVYHTKDSNAEIIMITQATFRKMEPLIAGKAKNSFEPLSICPFYYDHDFAASWKDWHNTKKMKNVSRSERAVKRRLNKLMKLSSENKALAIKIVDVSADKGYTDLYEFKDYANNSSTDSSQQLYARQSSQQLSSELGL